MSSQVETIVQNGNYFFKNYLPSNNAQANKLKPGVAAAPINYMTNNAGNHYNVTVQAISGDLITFKYWHFTNPDTNNAINGVADDALFTINSTEFKTMMGILYDRWEVRAGFFSVPYKLRFNDFDFESDVTVGMNISGFYRWNRKKEHGFAIEPILGIGLTKVNVDDSNSNVEESGSLSAFTVNTGLLFHLTEKINLGVFYGFDNLSKKDYENSGWKYNGKGWLGIGLNISFSETNNNKSESVDQ